MKKIPLYICQDQAQAKRIVDALSMITPFAYFVESKHEQWAIVVYADNLSAETKILLITFIKVAIKVDAKHWIKQQYTITQIDGEEVTDLEADNEFQAYKEAWSFTHEDDAFVGIKEDSSEDKDDEDEIES